MKIIKICLFLSFITFFNHLQSQVIEITVKDAINHAYSNDPNIIKTENFIEAQESNIRASYGNLFPDLKLTTGWTRTNQVTEAGFIFNNGINVPVNSSNETRNNFSLALRSDVILFNGFTDYERVDLAKETKIQYQIQLQAQKQDIVIKILADYIAILKNHQIVVINDSTLADSRVRLESIKIFVEVGKKTLADIYSQDVIVAQNELAVEQAKNNLNKSISDLAFDANLPLNRNYAVNRNEFVTDFSYEQMVSYVEQNANTEVLVSNAFRNRYDYKSTIQNLDIYRTNIEIARSSLIFPTLSGFGSYSLAGDQIGNIHKQRVFTVGLTLSYPIFQGFSLDNQRQLAIIDYRSAEEDVKLIKNQIELQIKKAILDLRSLLKQIEITERSLRNAEQNKLLADESYRVGIGTLLDANTAAVNLNTVLINKSNLIYDFIFAQKQLEYYQGLLKY